ncbi:MAG: citrate synthase [Phycisphaerales bacterium]|nr:citrate synthase [Phycisphaerales bacterium]
MSAPQELYHPGLEGVIAGETSICSVEQGSLGYRGYDIDDLARRASFEEVAYLLLHGDLPNAAQLAAFRQAIDRHRALPPDAIELLRRIKPEVPGMDVVRTGVSFISQFDPASGDNRAAYVERATHLLAAIPSLIAARMRLVHGQEPIAPQPGLSHAAQFCHQAFGRMPSEIEEKVLNMTFVLYAEHEFNASTFTARVIASTESDLYSAVTGAVGALKGPLHGGANEETARMFQAHASAESARAWIEDVLARKQKVMGFGHRVYKEGDHRARMLEEFVDGLAAAKGEQGRAAAYYTIKNVMREKKNIHMNLDYPCGFVYLMLDLPLDAYTPLFVASRVSGWAAHFIEQRENNRIIRPRSRYTGPPRRAFKPLPLR